MRKYAKFIVICVGLFYAWCIYKYFTVPVKTDIVKYGTLEEVESTVGYVIREESLIYSNAPGSFYPAVDEGERVSKGTKVATIYKGEIDPSIQEKIKNINDRIAEINNNRIQAELFAGDLHKLDMQISHKVDDITVISHTRKAEKLSQIKQEINALLDKKLTVSGENGPAANNLETLRKEKENYEKQLNAAKVDLYAQEAGVFSYHIDGLEQILVPANINQMLPSHFGAIDKAEVQDNGMAQPGQPVAKVINNFEWYLAVIMDADKLESLKVGNNIGVRFPDVDDRLIDASVYHVSQKENGKVLVVLLINKEVNLSYTSRIVNVDIVLQSHSGFKVPVSAVRVRDGKTGVYVVRDRIARFKEIEILYKNNDFLIAKEDNLAENGILLYDEVIVKSNNIEDGNLIR